MVAKKINEDQPKKRKPGRPKKSEQSKEIFTAEEIVPVSEVEKIFDRSELVQEFLDLNEKNENELTDLDLQNVKLTIKQTVTNLTEKIASHQKLLSDQLKKKKKVDIETDSCNKKVENIKKAIRVEQELLAQLRMDYENSDAIYVANRSPLLRWFYKVFLGRSDRIVLKSEIAILQEKINMRSLNLNVLERRQASLLLTQKSCAKVIRSTEVSYDSLLESRQKLQNTASQIDEALSSMEIRRSRKSLLDDYQESIKQLKMQSVTEEKFLKNILEDQTKVQQFLEAVQSESDFNRPIQEIIDKLELGLF